MSDTETRSRVLNAVDTHEVIELAKELVRIKSKNLRSIVGVEPRVGAVVPRSSAGNDTAHLFGAGIPCCLYGPAAEYDEKTVDRYTPVSQIIDCARVLAAALSEVCA